MNVGGFSIILSNLFTSLFLIRCTDWIEIVVASWLWGGHKQVPEYCILSSVRKLLEHQVMCVFLLSFYVPFSFKGIELHHCVFFIFPFFFYYRLCELYLINFPFAGSAKYKENTAKEVLGTCHWVPKTL